MKNLRARTVSGVKVENCDQEGSLAICINPLNRVLYLQRNATLSVINENGRAEHIEIDGLVPPSEIIFCEFLTDEDKISVVGRNGELLVIDVDEATCREVGFLPGPIVGAAWSPDQQLLVVATKEELFSLSRDFDVCTQQPLRPCDLGKDQLLTVGWGSRETQFQGAAGRKNREKIGVDKIPVAAPSSDDGTVHIRWRADGQFFVVSTLDSVENRPQIAELDADEPRETVANLILCRQLRTWSRDLEFMSKCEFLAGMEDRICVRPVGNLIATTQRLGAERFVRFFERNGQFRGKFLLGDDTASLKFIGWNSDGTVLAVHLADESQHKVQFWTVSNYDWALKLQYDFEGSADTMITVWDIEDSMRFHVLADSGQIYRSFDLYHTYCFDQGIALSFASGQVRLTDFVKASIPPPLCHGKIAISGSPSDFSVEGGKLAVVASNRRTITIYNVSDVFDASQETVIDVEFDDFPIFNLQWKSPNCLSAVSKRIDSESSVSSIVEIDLDGNMEQVFETPNTIHWHKFNATNGCYDLVYKDGTYVQVDGKNFDEKYIGKFPTGSPFCQRVAQLDCLLLLTRNHQLYLGDATNTLSGVSSFSVAGEFLLITTYSNFLFTINLKELAAVWKNQSATSNFLSTLFHNGRQLERGSVLVGHEENGTRVWLQMPRGNLETIHPRSLIIHKLRQMLDALRFGDTLVEMRRQRIDTNLLFDHSPELFLYNIPLFLDQVHHAEHLNLFLTNLKSDDSRFGMFSSFYSEGYETTIENNDGVKTAESGRNKAVSVSEICAKIREQIQKLLEGENTTKMSAEELVLASLSCYFMECKISEALIYIKSQSCRVSGGQDPMELFRRLLNYLTVLVNEQDLFQYSLQTYDLDLAVDVLNYTNRDPKEILPILNGFKSRSPAEYQRYYIDLHLQDYPSALRHIAPLATSDDERFAECSRLVESQTLHALAFSLFFNTSRQREICHICGKFALKQRSYNEAGILFYLAGDFTAAMDAFVWAQNARNCRFLYDVSAVDSETFQKAFSKLDQQLLGQHKHGARLEAFCFANTTGTLSPTEELIECCVNASEWELAFNYSTIYHKTNHGNCVAALQLRVMERVTSLHRQLDDWNRDLQRYLSRLEIVRATKLRQLREWVKHEALGEDGYAFDGMTETLSETSSVSSVASAVSHISQLSKVSTATSRKRKQIERKKKQVKEGSHYEDAALLTALKGIYVALDALQDELPSLMYALLAMGMIGEGRRLQSRVGAILNSAEGLKAKIWPLYLEAQHLPGPLVEIYRCTDGTIRLPPEGLMPPRVQIDDEMVAPVLCHKSTKWHLLMFKAADRN